MSFKRISRNSHTYLDYVISIEKNEIKGIEYLSYGIYQNDRCILFISQDIYKASTYTEENMLNKAKRQINYMNRPKKWYEK